eukprot:s366_g42.t1
MRQPWELTLPVLHKDVMEPFSKKVKVFGNLGPCEVPQPVGVEDIFDKRCNSLADAGIRLMKKTDEKFWEQQISFDRKAAYKKWTALILEDPCSWSVSRPKKGEEVIDMLRQGISESIRGCLGVKATSTLHGRVNPLIRYAQYCKDNGLQPFPIKEHVVYQFLKESDTAPTFPRSLLTSISFAKHVVGLLNSDEVLNSCRTKGHVAIHFTRKRRLVQRPPLSVAQVVCLEKCVCDEIRTMYDRIAAGFFLMLTFGRLRFSDG